MKRIAIVGISGGGKSTLAIQLSELLSLPLYHLDKLHWQAGWIPLNKEKWYQLQNEIVSKDQWIIDGNYGNSLNIRLARADTIIVLEINRFIALYQAFARMLKNWGKSRSDLNEDCPERFSFSFYRYIYEFPIQSAPKIESALTQNSHGKTIIRFKSRREITKFLQSMRTMQDS